ncbi:hypothetical protein DFH07DRAFT_774426 [Mycena maculata]|uniref:Uncharacterized protein n=1 Tax=Mycena maculata TaxID=230809 RepID=A0AAD7IZ97_9AGAR|nr:hypothetical protein DFH07DRAFT_774426 [Mycena maculata]
MAGLALSPGSPEINDLAHKVFALALTDDGPDIRQQPSKLFSTRDKFQELRAPEIPSSFAPIPVSEATRSVQSLLKDSTSYPGYNSVERKKEILLDIQSRVLNTQKTLSLTETLYNESGDAYSIRLALDAAAGIVASDVRLLNSVKTSGNAELNKLRVEVMEAVRALDQLVDYIGSTPSPQCL